MQNKTPEIFDTELLSLRRKRAAKLLKNKRSILGEEMTSILLDSFSCEPIKKNSSLLNIGCLNPENINLIKKLIKVKKVVCCDLFSCEEKNGFKYKIIKNEILPFEENSFDVVITNGLLHLINDLPGFLIQIYRILKQGGVFIGVFPGENSLTEFKKTIIEAEIEIKGGSEIRFHPSIDVKTAGMLVYRAGFHMPVSDLTKVQLFYSEFKDIVNDLRLTANTNILKKSGKSYFSKKLLKKLEKKYADYSLLQSASFDIITVTGRKR